MKRSKRYSALFVCFAMLLQFVPGINPQQISAADAPYDVSKYNLEWNSHAKDAWDSMPTGNGDIGINAWTIENGDLMLYISKIGAIDGNVLEGNKSSPLSGNDANNFGGAFVLKLGRLRVHFDNEPFKTGNAFSQKLELENGRITIKAGDGANLIDLAVWVDANNPVIHIKGSTGVAKASVSLETWRNEQTVTSLGTNNAEVIYNDSAENQLVWYHRNVNSTWVDTVKSQKTTLTDAELKALDPMQNLTFGCVMSDPNMTKSSPRKLETTQGNTAIDTSIVVLSEQTQTPQIWYDNIMAEKARIAALDYNESYKAHQQWWEQYWDRSYIEILGGTANAYTITQNYILQRFVSGCSTRGNTLTSFNGSIFSVDVPAKGYESYLGVINSELSPDYKAWANCMFMGQNTRHPYEPLSSSGDFDSFMPLINYLYDALPVLTARAKATFGSGTQYKGAWIAESSTVGGVGGAPFTASHLINDYTMTIEYPYLMLQYYKYSGDTDTLKNKILPVTEAFLDFFDLRFDKKNGKMNLTPCGGAETVVDATNPTPIIAGLRAVLSELLKYDDSLITPAQRTKWTRMLSQVPDFPLTEVKGNSVIDVAEIGSIRDRCETVQLYSVFPFRQFSLGTGVDNLALGRRTYEACYEIQKNVTVSMGEIIGGGWNQIPLSAASLGLAQQSGDVLTQMSSQTVAGWKNGLQNNCRFPAFWGPYYDWIPDQDHGGNFANLMQSMLLTFDVNDNVYLLPAWPENWNVRFKLYAPGNQVITAKYENGVLDYTTSKPEKADKIIDMMTLENRIHTMVSIAANDYNFTFGKAPITDGQYYPEKSERYVVTKDWMEKYGESINETTAGQYGINAWGGDTYNSKNNVLYMHLFNWDGETITLPKLRVPVSSYSCITGETVAITNEDSLIIEKTAGDLDPIDTIIKINLGGSAQFVKSTEMVDDTDSRITYSGTWVNTGDPEKSKYYNNNEKVTAQKGAFAEIRFIGTDIEYIASTHFNRAPLDIYLDGELVKQNFNVLSDEVETQKVVYSVSELAQGEHTLKLVSQATPSNQYMTLDAFKITSTMLQQDIASVQQFAARQVNNGTTVAALNLPATIAVKLNNLLGSEAQVDVKWNTEAYNPNFNGIYRITGTLELPAHILNTQNIAPYIDITVASNLALGKTPYTSNSSKFYSNGQWNNSFLFDGKKGYIASGSAAFGCHSNTQVCDIGVDFGTSVEFNTIALYQRNDYQVRGASYPKDFVIEVSNNGSNWTVVKTITNNTLPELGDSQILKFDTQFARYVRINVATTTTNDNLALQEFEVYYIPSGAENTVTVPLSDLPSGSYKGSKSVTLSCSTPGAAIYYTIDGSVPTKDSTLYTEKISIYTDLTIKAIAVKDGLLDSIVAEYVYKIVEDPEDGLTYLAFYDDFSSQTESNAKWYSLPQLKNGQLNFGTAPASHPGINQIFDNAVFEYDMQIASPSEWGGFLFNLTEKNHYWDNSGYMVYIRARGTVGSVEIAGGLGASSSTQIPNFGFNKKIHVKVVYNEGTIIVFVDDVQMLYIEGATKYTSGYCGFHFSGGTGIVDNVSIKTAPPFVDSEEKINQKFAAIKTGLDKTKVFVDGNKIAYTPTTSLGYSFVISETSNPEVISVSGVVTPPDKETNVTIKYLIKYTFNGEDVKTETYEITYNVPQKSNPDNIKHFLSARYGLFVHYVWGGIERLTTGQVNSIYPDGKRTQSIDEMIDNFDAEQFAQDCEDFGVQYVMFTTYHYGMNPVYPSEAYLKYRAHPENVPTEGRDLIKKVYDALSKKNIDLYLYTHPNDMHDFDAADSALFDYTPGSRNTQFNHERWDDYINETYTEICTRYKGMIKGFYIDEPLANPPSDALTDYNRLRTTIKSIDPTLVMIQNWYGSKYTCDTANVEDRIQGSINNANAWSTTALSYGARVGQSPFMWWAVYTKDQTKLPLAYAKDLFRFTVLEAGANTEGGGCIWGAGPYTGSWMNNGQKDIWEPGVREMFAEIGSYMKPISESVLNTLPSKSYPTPEGVTLASVLWGSATESLDGLTTYLHVLKPTSTAINGKTITIDAPKDGKLFNSASLLIDGTPLTFVQDASGIRITLPDNKTWDALDTVIKLTCDQLAVLKGAVKNAEELLNNDLPWIYPESSKEALSEAIESAKAVIENSSATKEQIIAETAAINLAIATYKASATTNSDQGPNYALNAKVTASSSIANNNSWKLEYLTDGLKTDTSKVGWTSDPHSTTSNKTEWVYVELSQPRDISRVDLTPRVDDRYGYGFPVDFKIQVSKTGTAEDAWITVASYTDTPFIPSGSLNVNFNNVEGVKYIRVIATKLRLDQPSGASYRMQLGELEAFGMSAKEAAYKLVGPENPASGATIMPQPTVSSGFTATIKSSSRPDVIAINGTITPPDKDTEVALVYTVANDYSSADSKVFNVIVPSKTTVEILTSLTQKTIVAGSKSIIPIIGLSEPVEGDVILKLFSPSGKLMEISVGTASTFTINNPIVGNYVIKAFVGEKEIGSLVIECVELDLWNPLAQYNGEIVSSLKFAEPIELKSGACIQLIVGGKVSKTVYLNAGHLSSDKTILDLSVIRDEKFDSLIIKGIKYPRLYSSFSFSFNLEISSKNK